MKRKLLIFVSHSHKDAQVAAALKTWIGQHFKGGVNFFVSTDSSSLPPGAAWFDAISAALEQAAIALALVTSNSIDTPWLYFESGAAAVRGIPLVPICFGPIQLNSLPPPLNQYQAVDMVIVDHQRRLLGLIADAANLPTPRSSAEFVLPMNWRCSTASFDWRESGALRRATHMQALDELLVRLANKSVIPCSVMLSGASLTEIVHVNTLALTHLAALGPCREIRVLIVKPGPWWSKRTAQGMCFTDSYNYKDSLEMCRQSRQDILKLLDLTKDTSCHVEARESSWPPGYTFALLQYEHGQWGFLEPILYGVGLRNRFCLMLGDSIEANSGVAHKLTEAFERMWQDAQPITAML